MNEECSNNSANKCAVISISTKSAILKKDNPFLITIEIENISYKPFPLNFYPVMVLQEKENNNKEKTVKKIVYRSIAYLESDSEFNKKELLWKGEKIEFQVDITDLYWTDDVCIFLLLVTFLKSFQAVNMNYIQRCYQANLKITKELRDEYSPNRLRLQYPESVNRKN